MLDIDINFLKFLLNPNYNYIKDDIEIIKMSFIKDTEPEQKTEITNRLNKVDFLFLTRVSTLRDFLCLLDDLLISDIYQGLAKIFSLTLTDESSNITKNNTNFITNILINNKIDYLYDDINLNILNTSILDYLTNISMTTDNENYKLLANKAIDYINEATNKYDEINKIIMPYYNLVADKTKKQIEIIETYQRMIIKKYSFLLSEKSKKIIKEKNDYNINLLLKNETKFNTFFTFGTIDNVWWSGEYISINDILKIKKLSNNSNIITELKKDINKYNNLIKQELEEYEFTIPKSEIKKYFVSKLQKLNETEEITEEISEYITNYIYNDNTNFFQSYLRTIILEPLKEISRYKKINKFSNSFYHLITHELYHVKDLPLNIFSSSINFKKQIPLIFDDNLIMLYETYTEYRAINKICNLINNGHFYRQTFINYISNNNYNNLFFILIEFFEKYTQEFEEALKNNNIKVLEKTLGKRNFKHIIKILNEFNETSFNNDLEYASDIIKTVDKYQKKVKYKQKIRKIIKRK